MLITFNKNYIILCHCILNYYEIKNTEFCHGFKNKSLTVAGEVLHLVCFVDFIYLHGCLNPIEMWTFIPKFAKKDGAIYENSFNYVEGSC